MENDTNKEENVPIKDINAAGKEYMDAVGRRIDDVINPSPGRAKEIEKREKEIEDAENKEADDRTKRRDELLDGLDTLVDTYKTLCKKTEKKISSYRTSAGWGDEGGEYGQADNLRNYMLRRDEVAGKIHRCIADLQANDLQDRRYREESIYD